MEYSRAFQRPPVVCSILSWRAVHQLGSLGPLLVLFNVYCCRIIGKAPGRLLTITLWPHWTPVSGQNGGGIPSKNTCPPSRITACAHSSGDSKRRLSEFGTFSGPLWLDNILALHQLPNRAYVSDPPLVLLLALPPPVHYGHGLSINTLLCHGRTGRSTCVVVRPHTPVSGQMGNITAHGTRSSGSYQVLHSDTRGVSLSFLFLQVLGHLTWTPPPIVLL